MAFTLVLCVESWIRRIVHEIHVKWHRVSDITDDAN